jgi:myosin heavy subunit
MYLCHALWGLTVCSPADTQILQDMICQISNLSSVEKGLVELSEQVAVLAEAMEQEASNTCTMADQLALEKGINERIDNLGGKVVNLSALVGRHTGSLESASGQLECHGWLQSKVDHLSTEMEHVLSKLHRISQNMESNDQQQQNKMQVQLDQMAAKMLSLSAAADPRPHDLNSMYEKGQETHSQTLKQAGQLAAMSQMIATRSKLLSGLPEYKNSVEYFPVCHDHLTQQGKCHLESTDAQPSCASDTPATSTLEQVGMGQHVKACQLESRTDANVIQDLFTLVSGMQARLDDLACACDSPPMPVDLQRSQGADEGCERKAVDSVSLQQDLERHVQLLSSQVAALMNACPQLRTAAIRSSSPTATLDITDTLSVQSIPCSAVTAEKSMSMCPVVHDKDSEGTVQQEKELGAQRSKAMSRSESVLGLPELGAVKADLSDALVRIEMQQEAIVSLQQQMKVFEILRTDSCQAGTVTVQQEHQAVRSWIFNFRHAQTTSKTVVFVHEYNTLRDSCLTSYIGYHKF